MGLQNQNTQLSLLSLKKGVNSVSRFLYIQTVIPGASICFDCSLDPSISAPTLGKPRSRTRSFNSHCVNK
ncbi:hypothetical protein T4E_5961 [Trichinella pseudospiralis]|uniref:Uncharacterized protein n=1 Tax=Trichinella pseudospiralis TaxID=6337 RepID=A0A0V0XZS0_TRIPS|nr:hypothetical protein T4E_5961 [Trichinella pseudospiralis]